MRLLRRFGLYRPSKPTTQVRVMSFSTVAMRRMRDLAPGIPTVYLMERTPRLLRAGQLPYNAGVAGPSVDLVRGQPDVIRLWLQRGLGVHVWTVDTREALTTCMAAGVDAVISNRPADVLRWREEVWAELGSGAPVPAQGG